MSTNNALHLPNYPLFMDAIAVLGLPISPSELHGVMCGYLCAGAIRDGEAYLRALMPKKKEDSMRTVALALFGVYAVSQQQLLGFDFDFQLLLPDDSESLNARAQAFSEWCDGFTQGMTMAGIGFDELYEEEAQEALQHLIDFAHLDCDALQNGEDDERALMEVNEYARMAVLRIYSDLQSGHFKEGASEIAH